MRVLSARPRLFVYALAVVALAHLAPQSQAHPPHSSGHGVNETTACTLWAADVDETNTTAFTNDTADPPSSTCELAEYTDIPLDSPPAAVADWNRGDLSTFPDTGAGRSVYPKDASPRDGEFVADAYVDVAAVQPSTQARLSPTDQPLYAAPNGTVLSVVDYRIDTPESDDETWRVTDHEIDTVRFQIDGQTVSRTSGDHTPQFDYALGNHTGRNHTLRIEATIDVEVERLSETCPAQVVGGGCVADRETETVTVSDSVDVVEYDLTVSGYRAEYPNGDFGLVVYKNRPWLGYSLPTGDVRGVWQFYAAQDRDWMTAVEATADGESERHGPVHPIQVNAYPIESGPTPEPRRNVTILETYGDQTEPPTLPEPVALDVFEQPYTASFGIATRSNTTDHDLSDVEASGLVRGVDAQLNPESFLAVPINRSNLTVSVLERTANATTVRVHLRDNATGKPIATTDREGYVVIDGQRYNTTENGTVTTTLRQPVGGIAARYEPGRWWYGDPGYVADSDVTAAHGAELRFVRILYQLGVPIGLFLVAVFIIDRFTGWHIWPPWRGLE